MPCSSGCSNDIVYGNTNITSTFPLAKRDWGWPGAMSIWREPWMAVLSLRYIFSFQEWRTFVVFFLKGLWIFLLIRYGLLLSCDLLHYHIPSEYGDLSRPWTPYYPVLHSFECRYDWVSSYRTSPFHHNWRVALEDSLHSSAYANSCTIFKLLRLQPATLTCLILPPLTLLKLLTVVLIMATCFFYT